MEEQGSGPKMLTLEQELSKGLLYHYTSLEGLLGIVESGSLRATHIRYLNDTTEFKNAFGHDYVDAAISSFIPEANKKWLTELYKQMQPDDEKYDTFVASLTDDEAVPSEDRAWAGDRLSQWRAYSGASGGFSLGFDGNAMRDGWESCDFRSVGGSWIFRCIYSVNDKQADARKIGTQASEELREMYESRIEKFSIENQRSPDATEQNLIFNQSTRGIFPTLYGNYFIRASRFKHEVFSEEREWRIVFHVKREKVLEAHRTNAKMKIVKFREGKFGVTPYIDFPLNLKASNNPLRRIVVGPGPHLDEAASAVRVLLAANGIRGVEVVPSKIPYRN